MRGGGHGQNTLDSAKCQSRSFAGRRLRPGGPGQGGAAVLGRAGDSREGHSPSRNPDSAHRESPWEEQDTHAASSGRDPGPDVGRLECQREGLCPIRVWPLRLLEREK